MVFGRRSQRTYPTFIGRRGTSIALQDINQNTVSSVCPGASYSLKVRMEAVWA